MNTNVSFLNDRSERLNAYTAFDEGKFAVTFRNRNGDIAQLHGIGIRHEGNGWYVYGEHKVGGNLFQGIDCYYTEDWRRMDCLGPALAVGADGSEIDAGSIVERPKVLRCPFSGTYVMFFHADRLVDGRYAYARIGVAVAESPTGPFRFVKTMRWHDCESRDIGAFRDEDGTAYLLSEDRRAGTHIYRLSDDYLDIVEDVVCRRDGEFGYESPVLVRDGGCYYWFGSGLTGWAANDNKVSVAPNLYGPWSDWRPIAPVGSHTFESQCTAVVSIEPGRYLYIGDRWMPNDLGASPVVIMPISLTESGARLVSTGSMSSAVFQRGA